MFSRPPPDGAPRLVLPDGETNHKENALHGQPDEPPVHGSRADATTHTATLGGQDYESGVVDDNKLPPVPVRCEAPQPENRCRIDRKSVLGRYISECLRWKKEVQLIEPSICKEPFPDDDLIFAKAGKHAFLLSQLHSHAEQYAKILTDSRHLFPGGELKSINHGVQPFIVTVYGPTGSGKSQFIRNVLSSRLIDPVPETIFFVTPEKSTVTPEEKLAWEAQCAEGSRTAQNEPLGASLVPAFVAVSFPEAVSDENLSLENPNNIFSKAARKGPICIIIDECMNQLGSCHSISMFFHALPSKIFGRYPKCNGYTVIVVLHNMNPRHDRGNIKDLKIQSKCHIISTQLEMAQIMRFLRSYSFGYPTALLPVLRDIVSHARMNTPYSWIIYNNVPVKESLRWSFYTPCSGLRPIFMNLQTLFYMSCQEIRRVFRKRAYSQMQYIKRLNALDF
ncbi:IVa2 [Psittacine adenovirus 3]|uniref:IVa2 n=1 Tax=Psittacine adenovirus 3 TaxID=1580497 RepID=A0A0A7JXY3_9ADEN|nr:IVa2 [Psittacine adenovirus 3]AIZ35764.1 IVa2 [Psittacine adenovirus 3]